MSDIALELKHREAVQHAAALQRKRQQRKDLTVRVGGTVLILAAWEILGHQMNPLLFAPPSRIIAATGAVVGSGELWKYLSLSLRVFLLGLSAAAVVGIVLGVAMARFRTLDLSVEPFMIALYSTPAVALMPLVVVWFGIGEKAKAVVIFLFALFPILLNTYQGVKSVDPRLLEVARSYRTSERALWLDVIVPSSLAFIVAGLRLAIGRGLVGMVIADLYISVSGIAYVITRYQQLFMIDRMFVPVVTLSLMGVTLVQALRWLEIRIAPWQQQARDD